jgi:NAD(P)-dependent dehydrogenase (short-subunit alcohol dehydrogenase family)
MLSRFFSRKTYDLVGKSVLVTGGSRGIGRAAALAFAREGCRLAITFRVGRREAESVVRECMMAGSPEAFSLRMDVTKDRDIKSAVRKVVSKFGRIDVLDNNAGVIEWERLDKQNFRKIELQVRTNLEGLIKVTRECLPHVRGVIVNVSSAAGKYPFRGLSTYCATKFGVRGFTQVLAKENPNLRVVCINPGLISTRMTGFKGASPELVGNAIVGAVKGRYCKSGGDVDVWKVLGIPMFR